MEKKFDMGQVVMTSGIDALEVPCRNLREMLKNHNAGNWGFCVEMDKKTNDTALKYGDRLMSVWWWNKHEIWIITESDRSATTILLPEEY